MAPLTVYSTGTISIDADATTVVGSGVIWTGNVRPGDRLSVAGRQIVIEDVPSINTLSIDAWPLDTIENSPYRILQISPLRYNSIGVFAQDIAKVVGAMRTDGYYVYVASTATEPDPSLGDDGQYAFQAVTGKLWLKEDGDWVFVGVYKGFGKPAPYDNDRVYNLFDVATLDGSSYVWINDTSGVGHAPPNATYWQILAAKGEQGDAATVSVGTVTTGAAGSNAEVSNSGTSGAAVFDFTIPRGNPGTGDMTSTNNLSDVANAATARGNLGVTAVGAAAVGHIPGEASNGAPVVGEVGEVITATLTGTASTSGTATNVGSITLTAGDWDVSSLLNANAVTGATTGGDFQMVISTSSTPATAAANDISGANVHFRLGGGIADIGLGMVHPPWLVRLSTTTTLYAHFMASMFTGSGYQAAGYMRARRMR